MTLGDPCKAQWGFGVTCHLGAWSVFRGIPDVQLQGLFGNTVGNASWVLPESLSKFPTTTNGYSLPPEDPCRSRLGRGFRATVCRWGAQSVFGRMTDIQLRAIFGQKIDDDASLIGEKSKQGTQLVLYKDFFLFTKVVIDGKTKPFRFGLTYYVKDTTGKAICEYVATALKEIGVDCRLNGIDIADLSATLEDKSFDAIYMGWSLGTPPENPKQLWHSSGAKEKGSSNIVGFVNNEADRIIEQLEYEYDLNERKSLYHRFHRILHEEQPYTFMYTPKSILLYRDYVQNVFIPAERSDLIPGADVAMPDADIFWLRKPGK